MIATVIPVLNESEYITACLDSLIAQTYPASQHMIFILDGGSSDNTAELVEEAILRSAQANGPKIELHSNLGKFVAQGRNKALELMPSTITHVLELIGHSTVDAHHLEVLVEEWSRISTMEAQQLGALGSRVLPRKGEWIQLNHGLKVPLARPSEVAVANLTDLRHQHRARFQHLCSTLDMLWSMLEAGMNPSSPVKTATFQCALQPMVMHFGGRRKLWFT